MNSGQVNSKQKLNSGNAGFECSCKKILPEMVNFCPYCGDKFIDQKSGSKVAQVASDTKATPEIQKVIPQEPNAKPPKVEPKGKLQKDEKPHEPFKIDTTSVENVGLIRGNRDSPLNPFYENLTNYLIWGAAILLIGFFVFKDSPKKDHVVAPTTLDTSAAKVVENKIDFSKEIQLINKYIKDGDLYNASEHSQYLRGQKPKPPNKILKQLDALDKTIERVEAKQIADAMNNEALNNAKFAMEKHKYNEAEKFVAQIKKNHPSEEMLKKIEVLMSQNDPDKIEADLIPHKFNQPQPVFSSSMANEWLLKAEQNIRDAHWTAAKDLLDIIKKSSPDPETQNKVIQLEALYDSEFKKALSQAPDAIN